MLRIDLSSQGQSKDPLLALLTKVSPSPFLKYLLVLRDARQARCTHTPPTGESSICSSSRVSMAESSRTLMPPLSHPVEEAVVVLLRPPQARAGLWHHVRHCHPQGMECTDNTRLCVAGADIQGKCTKNSLRRHILLRATNEKCLYREHSPLLVRKKGRLCCGL